MKKEPILIMGPVKVLLFKSKWLIIHKVCDDENCALCKEDGAKCQLCLNGFIMSDLDKCEPVSISTAEACNEIIEYF